MGIHNSWHRQACEAEAQSPHRPQSEDRGIDQNQGEDRGEVQGFQEREGFGVGWEVVIATRRAVLAQHLGLLLSSSKKLALFLFP
jgi:hypothetical protein